ncbi:hypothetical protein PSHT_07324 [Puccinia striiformis]|uniref:Uncharacterized protein n=1 Tax=Puccinia striiformis TaxID=27350 RepID=A0A2S4VYU5_9BASI|nr:hypothetical protein PSHT_07324 [Puccinia striiformis]
MAQGNNHSRALIAQLILSCCFKLSNASIPELLNLDRHCINGGNSVLGRHDSLEVSQPKIFGYQTRVVEGPTGDMTNERTPIHIDLNQSAMASGWSDCSLGPDSHTGPITGDSAGQEPTRTVKLEPPEVDSPRQQPRTSRRPVAHQNVVSEHSQVHPELPGIHRDSSRQQAQSVVGEATLISNQRPVGSSDLPSELLQYLRLGSDSDRQNAAKYISKKTVSLLSKSHSPDQSGHEPSHVGRFTNTAPTDLDLTAASSHLNDQHTGGDTGREEASPSKNCPISRTQRHAPGGVNGHLPLDQAKFKSAEVAPTQTKSSRFGRSNELIDGTIVKTSRSFGHQPTGNREVIIGMPRQTTPLNDKNQIIQSFERRPRKRVSNIYQGEISQFRVGEDVGSSELESPRKRKKLSAETEVFLADQATIRKWKSRFYQNVERVVSKEGAPLAGSYETDIDRRYQVDVQNWIWATDWKNNNLKRMKNTADRVCKIIQYLDYYDRLERLRGPTGLSIKLPDRTLIEWFWRFLFRQTQDTLPPFDEMSNNLPIVRGVVKKFKDLHEKLTRILGSVKAPEENDIKALSELLLQYYQSNIKVMNQAPR